MTGSSLCASDGFGRFGGVVRARMLVIWLLLLAVIGTLSITPPVARAASGDYIVVLRHGVSPQAHVKAMGVTPKRWFGSLGYEAVLTGAQLRRVSASPSVAIVTRNQVFRSIPKVAPVPAASPSQPAQVPSFAVRRIGGLASPTAAIDGIDKRVKVDVAILDTGVGPHPDLNVVGGTNCVAGSPPGDWRDASWHGTMVAGMVGAIDNSIGRVGVAPGARIWSVRVGDASGFVTRCRVDVRDRMGHQACQHDRGRERQPRGRS